MSFSQNHVYNSPGTYQVNVQVYSGTNAEYIGTGYQADLLALSPTSCGMFYAYVYQNTPSLYYWDVPLDCTGADGITTTITPVQLYYGNYSGLNPTNTPYVVEINSAWLESNGYVQATANQTINSFNSDGLADNSQMVFEITCDIPDPNPDFAVNWVWPSAFVAPLQTGSLLAEVCNLACSDTSDVTMSLNFPNGFVPNTSGLINPIVDGNNLTFQLNELTNCLSLNIPFTFPGNTPAGTLICFDLNAFNPFDSNVSNNSDAQCAYVLNSYDPNSKEVDHQQQIATAIQETLRYMIHFQNDGNFSALNVEIVDTISQNLDLSKFKLIGSDHGVAYSLDPISRVVRFVFNNINLLPSNFDLAGSQGYILYEIIENNNLSEGSIIENTAYIFFDYNPPIITNTTYNINTTLGIEDELFERIKLFPNPTSTFVNIVGVENGTVEIVDMMGQLIKTSELINSSVVSLDGLSDGIYTLIISNNEFKKQYPLIIKN